MVSIRAALLTEATEAQLADVAVIFDQYRQHYGEPVVPGQTLAWLTGNIRQRRLSLFTAHMGNDLAGLATTVALPASLQLSCYWQLRDPYVVPSARRCGAGRALLNAIRKAAAAAGLTAYPSRQNPATLQRSSSTAPAASSRWTASRS